MLERETLIEAELRELALQCAPAIGDQSQKEELDIMEGLLGLLVFGVLFFLMMRFGCGAHAMHGRGHGHGGGRGGGGAEGGGKDPVCGMQVGADTGYTKMHAGTRHWFCSKTCLDKFEAEPAKYATPAVQGGGHGSVHGGHP